MNEKPVEEFHNFVVVFLNSHFEIQSDELGHVAMSVRVFRAEDRSNFVYPLEVGRDGHLLRKLWRLCEERSPCGASSECDGKWQVGCSTFEVAELEHRRTGLRRGALKFGPVDFDETLPFQIFAENDANRVLESKYSLVCLGLCVGKVSERQKGTSG